MHEYAAKAFVSGVLRRCRISQLQASKRSSKRSRFSRTSVGGIFKGGLIEVLAGTKRFAEQTIALLPASEEHSPPPEEYLREEQATTYVPL